MTNMHEHMGLLGQKHAIAIHDISCVGRCSLTVVLPILSAAGIHTSVIPTALLSTHTGEFTGYTHLDLTDQLKPIANHIATLGLHFDALYSGYLASSTQARLVSKTMDLLCDPETQVLVDPAFADHGRLYSLMDTAMPDEMRKLCSRAHIIVPNLTEAAFLLNIPYPQSGYSPSYIAEMVQGLSELGPNSVVLTGISFEPSQTGIAVYQKGMPSPFYFFTPLYAGIFHGTGDVFASFLLSAMLFEKELVTAARLALELTHESIRLTMQAGEPLRYGVQFELVLPKLAAKIQAIKNGMDMNWFSSEFRNGI